MAASNALDSPVMTEPATRTHTPPAETGRPSSTTRGSRAATAPLRVAGTIPANVEPEDVRRDVRARRPSLVSALIHARALERGAAHPLAAGARPARRRRARSSPRSR